MSEYTPTTEEVRADYCLLADASRPREMQFDRWLAEVKAQAWEEGQLSMKLVMSVWPKQHHMPSNPYRLGETE